jgi:hypothetical protein
MRLCEVLLTEKSELAFLDLKKAAIKHIHKEFKLKADTPFKPVNKTEAKQALKDGELVVSFNDDGSYFAMGLRPVGGTWTTGKQKRGWSYVSHDVSHDGPGKPENRFDNWTGNLDDAARKACTYKNIFASVDADYDVESRSAASRDEGHDELRKVEKDIDQKFSNILKKVAKETNDRISDEIAQLLKQGDTQTAEMKIKQLKELQYKIKDILGAPYQQTPILNRFLTDVYKDHSRQFHSDIGYALKQHSIEDSKFMLKLGLYLMKMVKGEAWSGRIFKGSKK